jgi:redox-sensitive bicupin YhaK (pirin superfamily)
MFSYYKLNERKVENGIWGESNDTFFAADNEKYLGFGNLVQLTRSLLKHNGDFTSMKNHKNMGIVDIIIKGSVGFKDSLGQVSSFPESTVQVLSAGSGIYQREFNTGVILQKRSSPGFFQENLTSPR